MNVLQRAAASADCSDAMDAATSPRYVPLTPAARAAVVVLAIVMVADTVGVLFGSLEFQLLSRVKAGEFVTDAELSASDSRQAAIGIVQIALYLVAAIFFLRWFRRAYRNLPALGTTYLRWSPGWSVGYWFIPIWNLVRPKQLANDIWRASDPERPASDGDAWRKANVPSLLAWWWGVFLLAGFVGRYAGRASSNASDIDAFLHSSRALIACDVLSVIAAVLAITVVRRTTARQEARATRLATLSS